MQLPNTHPVAATSTLSQRAGVLSLLALIALIPIIPAFFSSHYPATHESLRYEELTLLFREAIAHGHLYPRWLPDLAGGRGYPTFVFYQPLVFWVGSLVSLLPIGPSKWMYAVDYLFFIIGVGGAYRLARFELSRLASFAAGLLFILTPYVFVNLHIRGDHSELASMMLLPWPLWAMMELRMRFEARRRWFFAALIGAIALAALVCAHPATAMVAVPVIGFLCILQTFSLLETARKSWFQASVCICILALAAASPYWFCVWQCKPFVHLERISQNYFQAEFHAVPLQRLLSNTWSFGVSASKLGDQEHTTEMSLPLGLIHLLLALSGIIAGWRKPWVKSVALAYAMLVFAILPSATSFWSIASNPLRAIQFPWRLLAVIAPLQLILSLSLLSRFKSRWFAIGIVLVVAGWQWQMFSVSSEPHRIGDELNQLTWQEADDYIREDVASMSSQIRTFAGMAEFDPIWLRMRLAPRGDRPLITSLDKVEYLPENSKFLISARITASKETGVRLEQYYFPGWHVEVNGNVIADDDLRAAVMEDGRMLVPVPAGASQIKAYYAGPPLASFRLTFAAVVSIGCVALLMRLSRHTAPDASSSLPPTPGTAADPSHSPPAAGA